jgi:hypothetical protein
VLTTDQKGTIAETAIVAKAIRYGLHVYRPVNDGLRWDLLFGSDTALLRVQCKWARRRGDIVIVGTVSARRTRYGIVQRTYSRDEIDVIAAYCAELDRAFLIPPDVFDSHPEVWLRLAPTKNNQRIGVRWASDFEFGATLGRHARGAIAQLGERLSGTQKVAGSSPAGSIPEAGVPGLSLFE